MILELAQDTKDLECSIPTVPSHYTPHSGNVENSLIRVELLYHNKLQEQIWRNNYSKNK